MPPLILASAFLEGLALTLIQGYLPLYVRRSLGEEQFVTVALVVAVPAVGTVIASNFWGGLSDVSGRLKPMILVGLAGYAIALAGIPQLREGIGVLAYVGLASLFYGTLAPSLKAYVTLARPHRREHALAYTLMAQSVGWLAGSYGAGWLLEGGLASGMRAAVWACAALLAAHAGIVAFRLRDLAREPAPARMQRGWLAGVVADLAALYENPRLLRLCVLAFFFVGGNYLMWGFFAVFLVEHLDASLRTVRYALAASSLVGIASFLWVGPLVKRYGGRIILAIGVTLYVGMYAGIAMVHDAWVVAALYALPFYAMVNVSANALAAEYSSAAQRGGGLGVLNGTYALATVAGPLTGGFLADRAGLGVIPWAALGYLVAACPLAWLGVREPGRNAG
jgi:MFS family permease